MDLDIVSIRLIKEKTLRDIFPPVTSDDCAANIFQELIGNLDREVMAMITLDIAQQPINASIVSVGTLTNSMAHPREIFKTAILSNAHSIILAHNHPSGSVAPSFEDEQITRRIQEAGKLLGIELIDHLIIGHENYYSITHNVFGSFSALHDTDYSNIAEPEINTMQKRLQDIIAKKKQTQPNVKKEPTARQKHVYRDPR